MAWLTARDGAKVFYREQGTGEPIILLHGFGMNSLHWLPFSTPLSRNARVIMPDLRGFGRSHATNFSDPCVLTNYANDIHDLVTQLQLDRFKLSGISMGALTSLQYQKASPQRRSITLFTHRPKPSMHELGRMEVGIVWTRP